MHSSHSDTIMSTATTASSISHQMLHPPSSTRPRDHPDHHHPPSVGPTVQVPAAPSSQGPPLVSGLRLKLLSSRQNSLDMPWPNPIPTYSMTRSAVGYSNNTLLTCHLNEDNLSTASAGGGSVGKNSCKSSASNRSAKSAKSTRSNRSSKSSRSNRSSRSSRSRSGGIFRRTASLSDTGLNLHLHWQKQEDLEQFVAATCGDNSPNLASCMSVHSLSESLATSYGTRMSDSGRSSRLSRRGSNESSVATIPTNSRTVPPGGPSPSEAPGNRRRVSFGIVEARAFLRTVGDHPAVSSGAGLDLTWKYKPIAPRALDEYESTRAPRRSGSNLIVSRFDREELLRKQCDIPKKELVTHVRSIMKTKSQRRQTLNNLRFHKMEEAAEKIGRNLSRAVGLRKSSHREIDDLWLDAVVKLSALEEEFKDQMESESETIERHPSLWRRRISQAQMGSKNISENKPAVNSDAEKLSCISHGDSVEMSKEALENIARRERAEMSLFQKISTSLGKKVKLRRKRNGTGNIRRGSRVSDDDLMESSSKHSRVFNLKRQNSDDLDIVRHQRSDCDSASNSNSNSRHRTAEQMDKDMVNNNSSRHHKKYDLGLDLDDDVSVLSNELQNELVSDADSKPAAKPDIGCDANVDLNLDSFRLPNKSYDLDMDQASASELDDGEFVTLNVSTEPKQPQDCSRRSSTTSTKSRTDEDSGLGLVSASVPTTYLTKELLDLNESEHSSIGNSSPSNLDDGSFADQNDYSRHSLNSLSKSTPKHVGNRNRGLSSSNVTAATAITCSTGNSNFSSTSRRICLTRPPIVGESKRVRKYTEIKRKCILATEDTCLTPSKN